MPVSILLLVDGALEAYLFLRSGLFDWVSILLLVDGALEVVFPEIAFRVNMFQSYFWWMVRWKVQFAAVDRGWVFVSILLLVDGALEAPRGPFLLLLRRKFQSYFWWMVRWKDTAIGTTAQNNKVSILLLVDGALEAKTVFLTMNLQQCFNPTFGGWCAGSL